MSERHESASFEFAEHFREFMTRCADRMWELPHPFKDEESRAFLDELRSMQRAFLMGPAGMPLLFTPRNREMLQKLFEMYGIIDPAKDPDKEFKGVTKDFLSAWLDLADEMRRHRARMWDINSRLMGRFGAGPAGTTDPDEPSR